MMPETEKMYRAGLLRTRITPDELSQKLAAWEKRRSNPEVFIVESLRFEDEEKGVFEGKILADVLRFCGKTPEYFYFRTAAELVALAELFEKSKSRYLHVSCHGTATEIETTLDRVPLVEFAKAFDGKLNNRRLFFSACCVGSDLSAQIIRGRNPKIYSLAGPETRIPFTHAIALWTGFYVKVFDVDPESMSDEAVELALLHQCKLFGTRLSWTYRTSDRWTTKTLAVPDPL